MTRLPFIHISLLLAAMAGACNYKTVVATRDFSTDAFAPAIKPSIDSVYLLGEEERLPDSSILLADLTLYSPMIWPESWDADRPASVVMLRQARKEARNLGGNAIQILDCSSTKFPRYKLEARIYSLKQPPFSLAVATDSCILHIKINGAARGMTPVPIHLNDSLIGISKGIVLAGQWNIALNESTDLHRVEQFTLESAEGGMLSGQQKDIFYPFNATLQKGKEYYMFVRFSSPRVWTPWGFTMVSKEEFELNQLLY